jgi:APA family basic amino acid/polyamine antiporter
MPLKRSLSKFDLTMIAIGSTIGSGIFLTPALVARELPALGLIAAVWIAGGLMALSGALTFAELGGMMPGAGGVYVYLSEAYGPLAGFLYGWAYFLVVNTGGVAALSLAFATYLGYFVPLGPGEIIAVAIGGLLLLTVINVLGVKVGGIFSDTFTLLKIGGILVLIVAGIFWGTVTPGEGGTGLPQSGSLWNALAVAMVGVLWSYGGWQHASYAAGEAKDPRKTVPFAMVVGALVVTAIYLLTNLAYLKSVTLPAMAGSPRLAADAMEALMGPSGGKLIAAAIFVSTFGTAGIYTLTAPRIYFAMANDGLFFRKVAAVHPRFGTPAVAIVAQSGMALLLILFWGTFENLISYVVFTDWIFFALAGASVFLFRKRRPDAGRPYRTWGYPLTPAFFVAVSTWFVLNTFFTKPAEAIVGLAFLAAGVPAYWAWRKSAPPPSGTNDRI